LQPISEELRSAYAKQIIDDEKDADSGATHFNDLCLVQIACMSEQVETEEDIARAILHPIVLDDLSFPETIS
jgi:hypothetical protein